MASDAAHPEHGLTAYVLTFFALLALTAVTFWVSRIELGVLNAPVALSIAGGKALLVILFFMHVRDSSRVVWIYVAIGFYWFALLVGLTLADLLTRGWGPVG